MARYNGTLFVTVTLNPAIDRTVTADRLVFDDRVYIQSRSESAGGRGLNASAVLHSWGAPTLAIVPSGGEAGQRFEQHLARLGFPYEAVPMMHNVRSVTPAVLARTPVPTSEPREGEALTPSSPKGEALTPSHRRAKL